MMKTLAIRHIGFEYRYRDLLDDVLANRGHNIRYHDAGTQRLDNMDPTANNSVAVLGGPISVYQRHSYRFLDQEIKYKKKAR